MIQLYLIIKENLQTCLKRILGTVLMLILVSPAFAVNPSEVLNDPLLENRAREISKSVRCLVCQNQSIDDSNAVLAKELRIIVRERLVYGDTDKQVLQYLTTRYGDYVLLQPPVSIKTLFLWGIPLGILLLGIWIAFTFLRKNKTAVKPLTKQETSAVNTILKGRK